jgi:Zn-dependent M16 (insulinase) family peptidase
MANSSNSLRSQRQLDEAKLRAFAKVDKPVPAYDKGLARFIFGIGDEERRIHRERMLGSTREEVRRCAREYLLVPASSGSSSRVIFGTEEVNRKEVEGLGWSIAKPVETS